MHDNIVLASLPHVQITAGLCRMREGGVVLVCRLAQLYFLDMGSSLECGGCEYTCASFRDSSEVSCSM